MAAEAAPESPVVWEESPVHVKVGVARGDFVGDTGAAIQQAIDAAGAYGGGVVELGPGVFTLYDSVQLRSNVRLLGAGPDTVLRKCDEAASRAALDPDYGQCEVTVEEAGEFRVGMGVMVKDAASTEWVDSLARITVIQGGTLYLDRRLVGDFTTESGCVVSCTFSPILLHTVQNARVENLTVDGNRPHNREINGCIGGGIFLRETVGCQVVNCAVRDFAGDGINAQMSQDTAFDGCEAMGVSGVGLHLGSGSPRPVVRNCQSIGNGGGGLLLCWRVQGGVFERNVIRDNGREGVSIGHQDTDNHFLDNVMAGNGSHGILLRDEKPSNAGSRNTFRGNTIEDNRGCGVCILPATTDIVLERNTIRDTRSGHARTQRVGIAAAAGTARLCARANAIQGEIEGDVEVLGN
jgi:parallel beta-helix repeat protein